MAAGPHPPSSPNLVPQDSWFFPTVKTTMKGKYFEWIQDIEAAMKAKLKQLRKEDFQICSTKWQEWWSQGIRTQGRVF